MKKTFEQEAIDRGLPAEDAKLIGKVADFAYEQEMKKMRTEEMSKPLKELLRTPTGCAHVLAELLVALENHDMITPNNSGHMPEMLMSRADVVLHIVKSRETREGWIAAKFPVNG